MLFNALCQLFSHEIVVKCEVLNNNIANHLRNCAIFNMCYCISTSKNLSWPIKSLFESKLVVLNYIYLYKQNIIKAIACC